MLPTASTKDSRLWNESSCWEGSHTPSVSASIRAHFAAQPDSATLESLAVLADRALASEADVEESKPGVAEIKVDETTKLVGLLEDSKS